MNAPLQPASIQLAALDGVLRSIGEVAVAVSGGVDSLTLAAAAHRALAGRASMYHAVSPAVLDAGEFGDRDYMRNPLDRCFYCKTNLYGAIGPHTAAQVVSGTNLDDLGEYRPGLIAAREHGVRHPFVEARIDKRGVRAIARHIGLGELAELPASPCLSSRIETGIAIDPIMLECVHESERLLERELNPKTVRCRVRAGGVVIELDEACLAALPDERRAALTQRVQTLFGRRDFVYPVSFERYRVGSAFLHFKRPGT
jgi:uncharacterized protein